MAQIDFGRPNRKRKKKWMRDIFMFNFVVRKRYFIFLFKTENRLGFLCYCAQSCPTLCHPMDYSPPGSSVHGILQARILAWVALPCPRTSSQPRDQTHLSRISWIVGRFFSVETLGKPLILSNKLLKTCGFFLNNCFPFQLLTPLAHLCFSSALNILFRMVTIVP